MTSEVLDLSKVSDRPRQELRVAPVADLTPTQMLSVAIQRGADMAQMEKLLDLQERWEKTQAKNAFNRALAAFKKNPPVVVRDLTNKQYGSKYASLGNLVNTVNAALGEHELSASWDVDQGEEISVTCILEHADGHERRVTIKGPPDTSGSKNTLQQIKSTLTYLKGATFEAVTGIATQAFNADDDGNGAGGEVITEQQAADLKALLQEVGADMGRFLKYYRIEALANIKAKDYGDIVKAVRARGKK